MPTQPQLGGAGTPERPSPHRAVPAGDGAPVPAVTVRYFAAARDAAGTGAETLPGRTVAEVLAAAAHRHGQALATVMASSKVWLDGEPAAPGTELAGGEEVAVLPPVSGGALG